MQSSLVMAGHADIPSKWEALFALVAEHEPERLMEAANFMVRHADAIFRQLETRYKPLRTQFEAVAAINYHPDFDDARAALENALHAMTASLDSAVSGADLTKAQMPSP